MIARKGDRLSETEKRPGRCGRFYFILYYAIYYVQVLCVTERVRAMYIIVRRLRRRPHTTPSSPLPPLTSIGVCMPSRAHALVVVVPFPEQNSNTVPGGRRSVDRRHFPASPLPVDGSAPPCTAARGTATNDPPPPPPPPPSDRPRPRSLDGDDGDATTAAASSVRRTPVRPVIRSSQKRVHLVSRAPVRSKKLRIRTRIRVTTTSIIIIIIINIINIVARSVRCARIFPQHVVSSFFS
jgi:hypothetical protein